MSWLIRPEYFCGLMLSLKLLGGDLCFSTSCTVSRYQASLLLEGGTSSSSFGEYSQVHLEFDPQIPLPPSKLLNLESQKEVLHLPLKAFVFDETQLPNGRSHLY